MRNTTTSSRHSRADLSSDRSLAVRWVRQTASSEPPLVYSTIKIMNPRGTIFILRRGTKSSHEHFYKNLHLIYSTDVTAKYTIRPTTSMTANKFLSDISFVKFIFIIIPNKKASTVVKMIGKIEMILNVFRDS